MAIKNLGLVQAIIVSQTPPTYTEVVWAEQYDPNDLSKTRLKYYDEASSSWVDLAYIEDTTYSNFGSGSPSLFSDGDAYTKAIAILEQFGYKAYQSDYQTLTYNSGTVTWDGQSKKQINAYLLVDSDSSPNKLTFTLALSNLIDGTTGELVIEQTVSGTIEITLPSQSYISSGLSDGSGNLKIYGASGERHIIGMKVRPDGSGGFYKYFTLQESFVSP